jgi:hypothetical protein
MLDPNPPMIVFTVGLPAWVIGTVLTRNPGLGAVIAGIIVFLCA